MAVRLGDRFRAALAAVTLLVVATGVAVPAVRATANSLVVYEVHYVGRTYPREVRVQIGVKTNNEAGVRAYAHLRRDGSRFRARSFGVLHYNGSDTRSRTYGLPVSAPECPSGPACGSAGTPYGSTTVKTFGTVRGDRILIAGVRQHLRIEVLSPSWRIRKTALSFRAVTAAAADATGGYVAGLHVEHFRSATAPGGRYGSAVFVDLPCAAGTATLRAGDGHEPEHIDCRTGPGYAFSQTPNARRWTVAGDVVGSYGLPYRMVVLDYPM